MDPHKQRSLFVVVLCSGLALIGLSVWKAYQRPFPYVASQIPGKTAIKSLPALPPDGWAENDTHGTVPGNPEQTVLQMHKLYQAIQTFQKLNGGALPDAGQNRSLISDIGRRPKDYGISTMDDLKTLLRNPDMKYADGRQQDPQPETTFPYTITATRPDGTAKGGPKPAGTRDVLAYTDMYFHRNTRNFKGKAATVNPIGFYLVLWDDGQVQKVRYQDVRFAQPEARAMGNFSQTFVFPGEAGAPSRTVSYAEYNKWIADHI